jgi:small subunit ribosomal protein S14
MAGFLLSKKNLKIRYIKDKKYIQTTISNSLLRDQYLKKEISLNNLNKRFKNKLSTISKIQNKCLLSGRNRAVLKKFKLSRMFVKNLGVNGLINGFRKASW